MLYDYETASNLGDALGLEGVEPDVALRVIENMANFKYWKLLARPARDNFVKKAKKCYNERIVHRFSK